MIAASILARYSQFGPTLLILCLTIGSFLLWRRSRRVSTLLQLISAAALFLFALRFNIRSIFVDPFHPPFWARILWSNSLNQIIDVAQVFCVVAFPIGYLWYAIRQKPSNQAMERTADRCSLHI